MIRWNPRDFTQYFQVCDKANAGAFLGYGSDIHPNATTPSALRWASKIG
jgi:hypothetical protein